jgi:cytochrome b involved in lipid metabolism
MKRNTNIIIGAIFIALVGVGFWGYTTFNTYAPKEYVVDTPTGSSTMNTTTGEVTGGVKTFSAADIATHKDATSCYTSISGGVYDLTAWVNMHPGGKQNILSICGIDGTQAFMDQHHGRQKFLDILARFKIGTLS